MAAVVKELDGRKWADNASGGNAKRRFRITGLEVGFSPSMTYTGLPAIGSAHPQFSGLICTSHEFEEGNGKEKTTVIVACNYEPKTTETSGSGQQQVTCQVVEWGWDDGTDEKELTTAADGTPVVNSAGDPFDTVPKVSTPAPTFTKVMKFKARQSGWNTSNCTVNSAATTIGGISFPIGSLLCTIAEKRIFGDADWKYQYTVHLRFKSNKVEIGGNLIDIGWDVAVTDAGMRELDNGKKVLIRMIDKETGKMCVVNSPALLSGSGVALRDDGDPVNIRFQAYPRAAFPNWFYSEPT